jgi:hypothetical protein
LKYARVSRKPEQSFLIISRNLDLYEKSDIILMLMFAPYSRKPPVMGVFFL